MKNILVYFVKKRNPNFTIDESVSSVFIFSFICSLLIKILRGMTLIIFGRNPKGMMMSTGVKMINQSKIRWGRYLKIGRNVTLSGLGKEGLILGNNVSIGDYSSLIVATTLQDVGKGIVIGNNVGLGEFAYLGGAGGLSIDDDCIIGQYFSCHPENHIYHDENKLIRLQGVSRKGIVIGKNCWIGSKVTVLDGVVIGDGCVVAAGSVVTKSFPDNSIIGGVPAKILKNRFDNLIKNNINNN